MLRASRLLPTVLLALCFVSPLLAQNHYGRLIDPSELYDLTEVSPLKAACFVGNPWKKDPSDGYSILGEDTGSGVITHFWTTVGVDTPDSAMFLKLYIDDVLIVSSPLRDFFVKGQGIFDSPFDTTLSGGYVCDLQMPYRKSFKITFKGEYLFCGLEWRPLPLENVRSSFSLNPESEYREQLLQSENIFSARDLPVPDDLVSTDGTVNILSLQTAVLHRSDGPGVVRELTLTPSTTDQALDSVVIEISYDGSPYPAISVPLRDFFAIGGGYHEVDAPYIKATDGRLQCFFPIPFRKGLVIGLRNIGSAGVKCEYVIRSEKNVELPARLGYFSAAFGESNPARVGRYHQIAYTAGRGRFVGTHIAVIDPIYASYLEGDVQFIIDSTDHHSFRYTGTEDYLNGGWYFIDSVYQSAFSGATRLFTNYYRYHILDCVDFTSSLSILLQHGHDNDEEKTHYRTVAFSYVAPEPFVVSEDTILMGDTLKIWGGGYLAGQSVAIERDTEHILDLIADSKGAISGSLQVDDTWTSGFHRLTANGARTSFRVLILEQPLLSFQYQSGDSAGFTDTILVRGFGFRTTDSVKLSIGGALSASTFADSLHSFAISITTPWLDSGRHPLKAEQSGFFVTAQDSVVVTRTINYEFEDLEHVEKRAWLEYYSWLRDEEWSNQSVMFYYSLPINDVLSFRFTTHIPDTFDLYVYGNEGIRYGDFQVRVDGEKGGVVSFYREYPNYGDVSRSAPKYAGRFMLPKGMHTISLEAVGKQPGAIETCAGLDNFVLHPVTVFDPTKSVKPDPRIPSALLTVFPNPSITGYIDVVWNGATSDGPGVLSLIDAAGREIERLFDGPSLVPGMSHRFHVREYSASALFLSYRSPSGASVIPLILY